jgi:hypothetical protein
VQVCLGNCAVTFLTSRIANEVLPSVLSFLGGSRLGTSRTRRRGTLRRDGMRNAKYKQRRADLFCHTHDYLT